jgi:Flp pilus assembly protein TadD
MPFRGFPVILATQNRAIFLALRGNTSAPFLIQSDAKLRTVMPMSYKRFFAVASLAICGFGSTSIAHDLKIPLPKRGHLTPVQRLNREGVEAVRKHEYDKAKSLFYKAYLFDPDDPFTLNNLGYISEVEGQVDRAQRYYTLAEQMATDAVVDEASVHQVEGKLLRDAINSAGNASMQVNQANVEAIRLLAKGRGSEADILLQRTLAIDPQNAFTLNNLGVAKETEGDLETALTYYERAAAANHGGTVAVTLSNSWRGKPSTELAADSATRLRQKLAGHETVQSRASRLNLEAVSAVNRNDWADAEKYFRQAYALDPNSAFSLNNVGFLAEMQGDSETAEYFYEKARDADGARAKVAVATSRTAEGQKLSDVAQDSDQKVDDKISALHAQKMRQGGPIEFYHRPGSVPNQTEPPAPQSEPPAPATPQVAPGSQVPQGRDPVNSPPTPPNQYNPNPR